MANNFLYSKKSKHQFFSQKDIKQISKILEIVLPIFRFNYKNLKLLKLKINNTFRIYYRCSLTACWAMPQRIAGACVITSTNAMPYKNGFLCEQMLAMQEHWSFIGTKTSLSTYLMTGGRTQGPKRRGGGRDCLEHKAQSELHKET